MSDVREKSYRKYRLAELTEERQKRTQNGGLGSGFAGFAEQSRIVEVVLNELVRFAEWIAKGQPEYQPPLTDAEKDRWRWARGQGMELPAEIEEQL